MAKVRRTPARKEIPTGPISTALRQAVEASGVSKYDLANQIEVSKQQFYRFLNNDRGFSQEVLDRLAARLGVQVIMAPQEEQTPIESWDSMGEGGARPPGEPAPEGHEVAAHLFRLEEDLRRVIEAEFATFEARLAGNIPPAQGEGAGVMGRLRGWLRGSSRAEKRAAGDQRTVGKTALGSLVERSLPDADPTLPGELLHAFRESVLLRVQALIEGYPLHSVGRGAIVDVPQRGTIPGTGEDSVGPGGRDVSSDNPASQGRPADVDTNRDGVGLVGSPSGPAVIHEPRSLPPRTASEGVGHGGDHLDGRTSGERDATPAPRETVVCSPTGDGTNDPGETSAENEPAQHSLPFAVQLGRGGRPKPAAPQALEQPEAPTPSALPQGATEGKPEEPPASSPAPLTDDEEEEELLRRWKAKREAGAANASVGPAPRASSTEPVRSFDYDDTVDSRIATNGRTLLPKRGWGEKVANMAKYHVPDSAMKELGLKLGEKGKGADQAKYHFFVSGLLNTNPRGKELLALPDLAEKFKRIAKRVSDPEAMETISINIDRGDLDYEKEDDLGFFSNLDQILRQAGKLDRIDMTGLDPNATPLSRRRPKLLGVLPPPPTTDD